MPVIPRPRRKPGRAHQPIPYYPTCAGYGLPFPSRYDHAQPLTAGEQDAAATNSSARALLADLDTDTRRQCASK